MAPKQKIRIEIVGADEIARLNREALLAAIRLSGMALARGPDGRLIVVDITHGPKEYYSIDNYNIVGPPFHRAVPITLVDQTDA
jgi:hypothetical protein